MRILPTSLTMAMLLSLGLGAHAEEVKPYPPCAQQASDPDVSGAKAAFQAGTVSFNEADYPRAILYWEDAFRRDCSATSLLFNLARAYELNGQKRQALVALETYLEREPNSSERPQIVRRIEVLKKSIESEPPPAASAAPAASAPPPQPTNSQTEPLPPPAKVQGRPILPLIVAGVGGAVFILGGLSWLSATGDVQDFEKQCDDPEERTGCPPETIGPAEDARKQQQAAGAFALIGLPVMVGGLIWYFATPVPSSASAQVTPAIGQNFVGLSVDGRF
jgi:tetratricopeptide (TPR) repeat protein